MSSAAPQHTPGHGQEAPLPDLAKVVRGQRDNAKEVLSPFIIKKPEDPEAVRRLQRKLTEYENRDRYFAPEQKMGTICKAALLREVLEKGICNPDEVARQLYQKYETAYDSAKFENAVRVIDAYCRGDLTNIHGGTGLPN